MIIGGFLRGEKPSVRHCLIFFPLFPAFDENFPDFVGYVECFPPIPFFAP